MKLNVFFIFLLLTSTYSFAGNSGDLISALYDADFSEDTEDITVEAPEQKPEFESSSSEQKVCTKKDQITVPYKILKGLLKNKRAYLVITSGGTKLNSNEDFLTPWLKFILNFFVIKFIFFKNI